MSYYYTISAIENNIIEFERRTGNKPTKVYLGNSEMFILKQELNTNGVRIPITSERPTINGLPIFVVNEESYVGVA